MNRISENYSAEEDALSKGICSEKGTCLCTGLSNNDVFIRKFLIWIGIFLMFQLERKRLNYNNSLVELTHLKDNTTEVIKTCESIYSEFRNKKEQVCFVIIEIIGESCTVNM